MYWRIHFEGMILKWSFFLVS